MASFGRDAGRVFGFDVKATDRRGAENGRSSIANVFVTLPSLISRPKKNTLAISIIKLYILLADWIVKVMKSRSIRLKKIQTSNVNFIQLFFIYLFIRAWYLSKGVHPGWSEASGDGGWSKTDGRWAATWEYHRVSSSISIFGSIFGIERDKYPSVLYKLTRDQDHCNVSGIYLHIFISCKNFNSISGYCTTWRVSTFEWGN